MTSVEHVDQVPSMRGHPMAKRIAGALIIIHRLLDHADIPFTEKLNKHGDVVITIRKAQ